MGDQQARARDRLEGLQAVDLTCLGLEGLDERHLPCFMTMKPSLPIN